jgi:hypothetical protein
LPEKCRYIKKREHITIFAIKFRIQHLIHLNLDKCILDRLTDCILQNMQALILFVY